MGAALRPDGGGERTAELASDGYSGVGAMRLAVRGVFEGETVRCTGTFQLRNLLEVSCRAETVRGTGGRTPAQTPPPGPRRSGPADLCDCSSAAP